MKNIGLSIEYSEGKSTILNIPDTKIYTAGEILCDLMAGNSLYILLRKVRVYPFCFPDGDDPITPDNVDFGEQFVVRGLLGDFDEDPVAAQLSASLFYRTIERHRSLIGRSQKELDDYISERNAEIAADVRWDYIGEGLQLRNMHGFLMTCYAEYLVDVIDSINFFESLAAVMSGTETEFDKEQVKWLNELLSKQESIKGVETTIRYDAKKDSYGLVYNFNSLLALVVFEYIQMKNNGVRLMKCQNPDCGRYFIAKRKTAMYCSYPARMMRWCCSMFKTGPITRVLNSMYRNQQVLTFYGIRKSESVSRSKYNRVEDSSESVKINKQTVAAPIFFWLDADIWLYILAEKIDFNDAYRLGYERVGCWLCPNNNTRDVFLANVYMPERAKEWREFLIEFAKNIGKPDPEEYIDSGAWKARQGGNGLPAAQDVKIKFTNCTTEEHAKIYKLSRPFDDELVGMFVPFGKLAPELGRKLLNETIVVEPRTNVPIMSIQPFKENDFEYAVKIRTMNVADHEALQRKAGYQVRKFNACHKCLKCESVCKSGAISIMGDYYYINPDKCVHCGMCVNQKILRGGCMMDKYLRTKD